MTDEPIKSAAAEAEDEEFSAAAPPHPAASGEGETSFGDAEAPPAGAGIHPAPPGGVNQAPPGGVRGHHPPSVGAPSGPSLGDRAGSGEAEPVTDDTQPASPAGTGKAAEYLELAKRTQADFENYRKRMARENAAAADRGAARLAKELLPALDHLELALKAAEGHEDVVKGFAMVGDEIVAALARAGIESFTPLGEPFDPNEHEAMASQPSEDAESGTVIEVYQQGYRLNGTVLRPARVVVAE
jgi:molecular chaperone GrpE